MLGPLADAERAGRVAGSTGPCSTACGGRRKGGRGAFTKARCSRACAEFTEMPCVSFGHGTLEGEMGWLFEPVVGDAGGSLP